MFLNKSYLTKASLFLSKSFIHFRIFASDTLLHTPYMAMSKVRKNIFDLPLKEITLCNPRARFKNSLKHEMFAKHCLLKKSLDRPQAPLGEIRITDDDNDDCTAIQTVSYCKRTIVRIQEAL